MDSHTKVGVPKVLFVRKGGAVSNVSLCFFLQVFSLFLDTLNELIVSHHEDLKDFLYILLTRLLNKSGADLLVSQQNKIHKSLEVVR